MKRRDEGWESKQPLHRKEEGWRSLRLHNNRLTTLQVLSDRLNVLPHGHIYEFTEFLPDLDLLTGVDGELEVLWSLEDQDDGATQAEPAHLLSGFQGLTVKEGRSGGIHGFVVRPRRWKFSAFVRPKLLQW